MTTIRRLLEPGRIGPLELRNRVCMPAMGLNFSDDHTLNDRWIGFYEERARGEVGLIIIASGLEYTGQPGYERLPFLEGHGHIPSLGDDRYLPGWRRLVEVVHRHGGRIGAQIVHVGKYAHSSVLGGQRPISPSPIKASMTVYGQPGEMPREMTRQDIRTAIENIADTVRRARAAGLDLAELNLCSGYLMREFLSPLTNQRTDAYGGSLDRRLRFVLEAIARIREKVGPDFPLTARLSADEFLPGGNTPAETTLIARALERAGIAAISVVGGGHETTVPLSPMSVPRGAFVYLARAIKEAVGVPVMASGRINDPGLAEEILARGDADFVAIARPLLADPDFVRKAREGRTDEIRPCIACNQGCFDMVFEWKPIFCLMNARVGWEQTREIRPAERRKRVMVVGGGPAGLEAARVLALRGHAVSLHERAKRLGGQVNLSAMPPGREEFAGAVAYLSRELARLGVPVHLGDEVTPERMEQERPDAVVVATGAEPAVPDIPGIRGSNVVGAWDVLAGTASTGARVIVLGGGSVGCETAMELARRSGVTDVTIVEALARIGRDFGRSNRWVFMQAIQAMGIGSLTGVVVDAITPEGLRVREGEHVRLLPADTVVVAAGSTANARLHAALAGRVPEIHLIGDARAPRRTSDAVHEGFLVGCEV